HTRAVRTYNDRSPEPRNASAREHCIWIWPVIVGQPQTFARLGIERRNSKDHVLISIRVARQILKLQERARTVRADSEPGLIIGVDTLAISRSNCLTRCGIDH